MVVAIAGNGWRSSRILIFGADHCEQRPTKKCFIDAVKQRRIRMLVMRSTSLVRLSKGFDSAKMFIMPDDFLVLSPIRGNLDEKTLKPGFEIKHLSEDDKNSLNFLNSLSKFESDRVRSTSSWLVASVADSPGKFLFRITRTSGFVRLPWPHLRPRP